MADRLSKEIANSLTIDLKTELDPIKSTAENISSRLTEIETFYPKGVAKETLTSMLDKKDELENVFNKIDNLELLMSELKDNLEMIEKQVKEAEVAFNIPAPSPGIFGKLNNILTNKSVDSKPANIYCDSSKGRTYTEIEICKTEKFFNADSSSS